MWLQLAVVGFLFQASGHAPLPAAAKVLDRYSELTHAAFMRDKKITVLGVDFSVSSPSQSTYYASAYRERAGRLRLTVEDDNDNRDFGVSDGQVWSVTKQGSRLMTGKMAAQLLAESSGLSAGSLAAFVTGWGGSLESDDWRDAFPTVRTVSQVSVQDIPCYELQLTRKDGSILRRWYEVRSGLLRRESASEFDLNGAEHTYQTDVADYATSLGFTYPSLMTVKTDGVLFTVKINSVQRGNGGIAAFEMPREVAKAIAQANTPAGLPNAIDLIERFVSVTKGSNAQEALRSQIMKGNMSMQDENLKVPILFYASGRKNYSSIDVPTMGKFEFGSNGEVAWERSVVLGPKLRPGGQFGGLTGPDVEQILNWVNYGFQLRTAGEETVNGFKCFVVEIRTNKDAPPVKACFDEKTGYLLRLDTPAGAGQPSVQLMMSDYRTEGGFTVAHHFETTLSGHVVLVDVTEIQFNIAVPEKFFVLPEDVAELLQNAQKAAETPADRPSLKRRPN